jgi:hypothetical protein
LADILPYFVIRINANLLSFVCYVLFHFIINLIIKYIKVDTANTIPIIIVIYSGVILTYQRYLGILQSLFLLLFDIVTLFCP